MKKRLLLVMIFIFPLVINASCDTKVHEEYLKLASSITYDNNYNKANKNFTFTIYNITDGMYVKYGSNTLRPDSQNKVEIKSIQEGSNVKISIYANDGCDQIKYIGYIEPYYNTYYRTDECVGYEDMDECAKEFTSTRVTKDIMAKAKEYYNKRYKQGDDNGEEEDASRSIFDIIKELVKIWWVKILLSVATTIISISLYRIRFRKIKHGI